MGSEQAQSKREMPIAEVVRLIDLVNYQEGAVVSRTLVNRTTGTVTLFAFDDGQGLSEHTAPFDALAICWRAKRKLRFLASHYGRRQAKRFSCQQTSLTL